MGAVRFEREAYGIKLLRGDNPASLPSTSTKALVIYENLQALHARMGGNWYLRGDCVLRCEKGEIRNSVTHRDIKLTDGEIKVINLLLQAHPIDSMAKELGVAKRTVKAYLNRIYLKFSISDRWVKNVRLIYLIYHPEEINKK